MCVMGAGIVGLASAYAWRPVTVVDRGPQGGGASAGNGAQLSYSYVQPLADPGIWRQLPKLLLSPDSPLKLRPRLNPAQWRWGWAFLAACNARTSAASTVTLLVLAARSREAFDRMLLRERFDCDFSATAKLVLYPTAEAFAGARQQLELQRAQGSAQYAVSAAECVAIEPALAHYQGQIADAIHTPSECAADCLKTCTQRCAARACASNQAPRCTVSCSATASWPHSPHRATNCWPSSSCWPWARSWPASRAAWGCAGRSTRSRAIAGG